MECRSEVVSRISLSVEQPRPHSTIRAPVIVVQWKYVIIDRPAYTTPFHPQEELHETVLKQKDVLLDNSKELRKYSALKVDHAAEVRQHEKVARSLQEAEGNIRRVNIRLEVCFT